MAYPWSAGTLPDYAIPIQVTRFENDDGGTVHFEARCAIRASKTKRFIHVAESRITERAPSPDTQGTVLAMGAALCEFGREIPLQSDASPRSNRVGEAFAAAP